MSKSRFQIGDLVTVKKGLAKAIRQGLVSNEYNYVADGMEDYAEMEKVFTIQRIFQPTRERKSYGYKVKGCAWDFTYNEAWLLPAHVTNEKFLHVLQENL